MTTTLDLDEKTAARTRRDKDRLPWTLFGVACFVVLALVGVLAARPPVKQIAAQPDVLPSATPTPTDPTITDAYSDGIGMGPTVWRDQAGQIITVMDGVRPYGSEEVWCKLVVGATPVEVHAADGQPAICVWVRDAA